MGRVLTNNFELLYGIEPSLAAPPTVWKKTEPNSVGSFGADITTVPRRPISQDRQKRKGTPTDLDSGAEFEFDLTIDGLHDFLEGFVFAEAANADLVFKAANISATPDGYVIPAATQPQADKLQWVTLTEATLLFARGYVNAGNNGIKVLTADVILNDTKMVCAGQSLVVETAPANAQVEVCGIRAGADDLSISVTSGVAVITSAANVDFTSLGLKLGQFVHVGGLVVANQFGAGASIGFGRVTAITTLTLTLDKITSTLITDNGLGDNMDILFGRFFRNVSVDAASADNRYLERTFQFEGSYPNLQVPGPGAEFEYAKGNFCNELALNLPLTDKATVSVVFIGTDTEVFTTSRKSGASTATAPLLTTAFNTSMDVARLTTRLAGSALDTSFKSLTLTLNNNASPEKKLGQLGAAFVNVGIFEVTLEAQLIFTDSRVPNAIRNNSTLTFDAILNNGEGAICIDIPSLTFGGGDKEYPADASLLINVTGDAFQDATLGTSLGISYIPITP